MQLTIHGYVVKVYRFADDSEMSWFQVKPILTFLGYTHVTMDLGRLDAEDKMSLDDLVKAKGFPVGGVQMNCTPLGHNDGKAIYVNEPGIYTLVLGSKKKEARDFKRWVTREVLPALRRHGSYRLRDQANDDSTKSAVAELRLALVDRDDKFQLALVDRDRNYQIALVERDGKQAQALQWLQGGFDARVALLEAALVEREERILCRLGQQCEQLSLRVVVAMQRRLASVLQPIEMGLHPLAALAYNVSLSVRGAVKDVIDAAVTSTDSKLVNAFRAATKAPAKRSSSDAAKFPATQRGTPKQQVVALSLAKVAWEEFPSHELHFDTWKSVRSEFGKRAKAERMRRHALAADNAEYEKQPLLWCTGTLDGCRERYLYLDQHMAMLRGVWHHRPPFGQSLQDWAVELQVVATAVAGYVEAEWPENAAEHEPFGWV